MPATSENASNQWECHQNAHRSEIAKIGSLPASSATIIGAITKQTSQLDSADRIGVKTMLKEVLTLDSGCKEGRNKGGAKSAKIGSLSACNATINEAITKQRRRLDSACRIGLKTTSQGVLTVVDGC